MFDKIPSLYIGDGHHRTAAAYNVGKIHRDRALEKGIAVSGEEEFNWFMAIIYPQSNLRIRDYNRLIKSLGDGWTVDSFLEAI